MDIPEWTVERHLEGKPREVMNMYRRFVEVIAACGPSTLAVSKTGISFKGVRRGFAGAKPKVQSLDGYLDLQRVVQDRRFLRASPYTKRLFVHQFRITTLDQLDDTFAGWVKEAYA